MLFAPDLHEPVIDAAWDPERVRAGIRAIADDAETAFDDGWLMHPSDDPTPDDIDRPRNMYYGGAGVVRALTGLAERDLIEPGRDYVPYLDRPFTPDCASLDHPPSLWGGELGILYVLYRLAPSTATAGRIAELVAANAQDPHCELMWGSPGSMLVARAMHEATGEDRWLELWRACADWLRGRLEPNTGVWQQKLYGELARYIGPGHGFAGCVLALSAEPDAELERLVVDTTRRYAVEQDGQANWPPVADPEVTLEVPGQGIRTQWCHGAPGMVTSLTGRSALGRGRYTLWTGDVGTALYLADCLDGRGRLPLPRTI